MKVSVDVKVQDNGAMALLRRLDAMRKGTVDVGILKPKAKEMHDSGRGPRTFVELATTMEFGFLSEGKQVPARSFIGGYFRTAQKDAVAVMSHALVAVAKGALTPDRGMEEIGLHLSDGMKAFIKDKKVQPPLAGFTIRKKGDDTPLLETGQLMDGIGFRTKFKLWSKP